MLVEWISEDRDMYKNHLRTSRDQFFELLSIVKPYIEKQDTNMRECISAHVKLQIALRYLAAVIVLVVTCLFTRVICGESPEVNQRR